MRLSDEQDLEVKKEFIIMFKVVQEYTPIPKYLVQDAHFDSNSWMTSYKGECHTIEQAQAKFDELVKTYPMKKIRIVEV